MRVFRDLTQLPEFKNAVITIGTFDGVHLGHQKLIGRIKTLSKQLNGESIIITFHPHPRIVINPADKSLRLLNTIEEKIALLERYGVDNVVIVPFSRDFSEQAAEDYISHFLVKNFHPKYIVIGYDHKFGKDRRGDYHLLEKMKDTYHYQMEEIPKEMIEDMTISSTKIRAALAKGEVELANELLGHRYTLSGTVVKGQQNGRKLGYPTANIKLKDEYKLAPKTGVYIVEVVRGNERYKGMLNIGYNPTFGINEQTIEVNILDFEGDIYGEYLTLELIAYRREEKKFDSLEALIAAIKDDETDTRNWFAAK
ncbi:MAG TPA: bifunctional riboflavin kinase/FAD synthetase [Chitinophagales bacterium]|nr:bifunctional riboflavin kinase/FAD synthetase [Chitinophagales bacterium]